MIKRKPYKFVLFVLLTPYRYIHYLYTATVKFIKMEPFKWRIRWRIHVRRPRKK